MGNSAKPMTREEKYQIQSNQNIVAANRNFSSFENQESSMLGLNNDNFSRIKQSLKYLYKNNFTSLTFEDLNAYYIQINWKHHISNKNRESKKGIIDIIFTPIDKNPNVTSRQDRIFTILDVKKYPYRCYDLNRYKNLKGVVEFYGGYENLPVIFINDYFIGTAKNFQDIEDMGLTLSIINKDYLKRCLACNIIRTDLDIENCPYCYKNYLFFSKSELKYKLYKNRHNLFSQDS